MKISNLFMLIAVLAAAASPAPAEEVRRSVEASADGTVTISNTAGSISVSGWSREEVEVSAELGRGVDELVVERQGDEVLIKVEVPRQNARNISSELSIRVPEGSSLNVAGVSSNININGVSGEQRLHTVSGDIVAEAFGSDVQIEAVSGDVRVEGDDRPIHTTINSVSGDLNLVRLRGELRAETVSGELVIADSTFGRVRGNTVNGDLVYRAALEDGGRLEFETVNGDVDVNFAGEVSARFDIETFNGQIRNCFGPEPERTSRYAPGRELKFTEGEGASRVFIRTLNGGLTICKD